MTGRPFSKASYGMHQPSLLGLGFHCPFRHHGLVGCGALGVTGRCTRHLAGAGARPLVGMGAGTRTKRIFNRGRAGSRSAGGEGTGGRRGEGGGAAGVSSGDDAADDPLDVILTLGAASQSRTWPQSGQSVHSR